MLNSINYLTYLAFSIFITVFVARTLSKNGLPFLVRGFKGNAELAVSTNHLLVVGFYLVNFGFVTRALKEDVPPFDLLRAIELLSSKVGLVLMVLGAMHFINMYVFSRLRRRAVREMAPPPVPPSGRVPVKA